MKKKILYSIFLGAVLSSTGAAAITGGGGGGGVNFIFDAFSGIVAGEVNSWMDLLLVVILPFLGVYGVSRYLTGKALEIAESNFAGSDSYGGTELGSTEKRMAQFISLAIAAPVVMYFGNIIPFFSLLLSGIAVIWFGWQFIGGGLASKWSRSNSEGGSSVDHSQAIEKAGGVAKDIASWTTGKGKKFTDMVEQKGSEKLEDRRERKMGRDVAKELDEKLMEFENADQILQGVLSDDYKDLREDLREDQKAFELDEDEEEKLENLLNLSGRIENQTEAIIKQIDKAIEQKAHVTPKSILGTYDDSNKNFEPNLKEIHNEVKQQKKFIQSIIDEEHDEEKLVKDSINSTFQDIEELLEAHEIIKMLVESAEYLEKEETELEAIARDTGDEELAEEVQEEEKEELQLEEEIQQIEKYEKEAEKTLKEVDKLFRNIAKIDNKEIEEIRSELKEDGKIEQALAGLEERVKEARIMDEPGGDSTVDVLEEITNLRTTLNEIDEELKELGQIKENESNKISKLHERVQRAIEKEEQDNTMEKIKNIRK